MSRDTKIGGKSSVSATLRLSLSPCGERFGEGKVPLLGKRGRSVVKKVGLERVVETPLQRWKPGLRGRPLKKNFERRNDLIENIMATIVLDVQDESLLMQIKKACQLLKGVASVKVQRPKSEDITKTAGYKETQEKMVKDSLTRAFDELHAGEVRKNARMLFK